MHRPPFRADCIARDTMIARWSLMIRVQSRGPSRAQKYFSTDRPCYLYTYVVSMLSAQLFIS